MVQKANTVFRDFVTDGIPSSGKNDPDKVEIRKWGTYVENGLMGATAGATIYDSKSDMEADTSQAANAMAWVLGDDTAANNGVYQFDGTSTWTRLGDLPYSYIKATNAGAGTANAIQATTSVPVPAADGGALIALPIVADNTASPVTVAFNGGAALTIKTASGNDPVVGGLQGGVIYDGYVSGSGTIFQLRTDQASAAIVAQVEADADRAEAAAASIDYLTVADRTALEAVDATKHTAAYLRQDGSEGQFFWNASDFSDEVDDDPRQIRYVPPSSDTTGASGAWIWVKQPRLDIRRAGVLVDGTADTTGENRSRFNDAIEWAASEGMILFLDGGECRTKGGIYLRSNTFIEGTSTFKLIPTDWSGTSGAIITNVRSGEAGTSDVSNIRVTGLNSDGSELPYDGNGNDNAYGFAWTAKDIIVRGGFIENYQATHNNPITGSGGGKAVQCEYGARDIIFDDLFIRNCYTALNANGNPGTHTGSPDGDLKQSIGIMYKNMNVYDCDVLIAMLGTDNGSGSATGDPDVMHVMIQGIVARNVGFCPNRKGFTSGVHQKGAPIITGNGQNIAIRDIDIINEDGYADYSSITDEDLIGYGFTDDCVGAVIMTNGNTIDIDNVRYWGESDHLLMFKRARVVYDDASNSDSGGTGQPEKNFRQNMRNIKHFGTINDSVLAGDVYQSIITPSNTNLSGEVEVFTNVVSGTLVDATLDGRTNVVATLRDLATRKIISGTIDQIYDDFNTGFSSTAALSTYTAPTALVRTSKELWQTPTIADDGATSWSLPAGVTDFGLTMFIGGSSAYAVLTCIDSVWNVLQPSAGLVATTTGALTGTTGADGKVTVSYSAGKIYIENRLGSSQTWNVIPTYYA